MKQALQELREASASLSKLLKSAKTHEATSYAKGYIQGLEHSTEMLNNRIAIIEQTIRVDEIINKNNSSAAIATAV